MRGVLACLVVALLLPPALAWDQLGGGPGHPGTAVLIEAPLDVIATQKVTTPSERLVADVGPAINLIERQGELV